MARSKPINVIPIRCDTGTRIPLEDLEPFQGTLKTLSKEQYKKLRTSIERYGVRFPFFVWTSGKHTYTLDGHQRAHVLATMRQEGWQIEGGKIPIVRIQAENEAEAKQLILLATSQYAKTDPEGLYEFIHTAGLEWQDLKSMIELPGIRQEAFETAYMTDDVDEDEPAEIPTEARTKLGDIYDLGEHRIICGDCQEPAVWKALMAGGERAAAVFTDPPYNVDYEGSGKNTSRKIDNDNLREDAFRELLIHAFTRAHENSTAHAPLYSCYASRTHREFEDGLNAAGWTVRNQIIWVKPLASFGWGDYRWKHEPIFYAVKTAGQGTKFYGDRSQYTEWTEELTDQQLLEMVKRMIVKEETDGSTSVWRLKRETQYDHPTQKPLALIQNALKNSTRRGDIVVDMFSGAGSTLIAAHQMNRIGRAIEQDPAFVDATVKRYTRITGTNKIIKNGREITWSQDEWAESGGSKPRTRPRRSRKAAEA